MTLPDEPMRRHSGSRDLMWVGTALLGLLVWEVSRLDLPLARSFGNEDGFPWRDHWLLSGVMHGSTLRLLGWLIELVLLLGIWWPVGWLRRIDRTARVQLALTPLLALLAISLLKGVSTTSCPWDLREFGRMARHVPHWPWFLGVRDGGGGHCFPAGHASTGFAFIGGWFVFREHAPRLATGWLLLALATGLALGLAQQMRGAHFMSHTLWTAWICWSMAAAICWLMQCWRARRQAGLRAPARWADSTPVLPEQTAS